MIELVRTIPFEELFEKLRTSTLENADEEIRVYENARFELRAVYPREVNLSTFYLLEDALERQRKLRAHLKEKYSIDTLRLSDCLELKDSATGTLWIMMPPIVEVYEELVSYPQRLDSIAYSDHLRLLIPTVLDGHHRLWIANEDEPEHTVNVVYITGSDSWNHPFYAYPNGWDRVQVYRSKDEIPRKKLYRRTEPYSRTRDLRVLGFSGSPGITRDKKNKKS